MSRDGGRAPRRVAVTSPQTRVALAGRRGPPARAPRLAAARLVGAERERAERIRRRQLGRAVTALLAGAGFLVGLPLVLHLAPGLDAVRLLGVPVSWLAVAVLPYPVLSGLAWWQLRRAEAVERGAADGAHDGDGASAAGARAWVDDAPRGAP